MWQHVQVTGIEGILTRHIFKEIAISEMKHAEELTERISSLNGIPTEKPEPIFVGGSLIEMLKQDQQDEEKAIRLYKNTIQVAEAEKDFTTRGLLEKILSNEEKHIDIFGKMLVGKTAPFTQPNL
jgi:bacterioferritin